MDSIKILKLPSSKRRQLATMIMKDIKIKTSPAYLSYHAKALEKKMEDDQDEREDKLYNLYRWNYYREDR